MIDTESPQPGRPKGSTVPIATRFWKKVKKIGQYWKWTGAKSKEGYGRIWDSRKKASVPAHVISWKLEYGTRPPKGYYCQHVCCKDFQQCSMKRARLCVNPRCLTIQTALQAKREWATKED